MSFLFFFFSFDPRERQPKKESERVRGRRVFFFFFHFFCFLLKKKKIWDQSGERDASHRARCDAPGIRVPVHRSGHVFLQAQADDAVQGEYRMQSASLFLSFFFFFDRFLSLSHLGLDPLNHPTPSNPQLAYFFAWPTLGSAIILVGMPSDKKLKRELSKPEAELEARGAEARAAAAAAIARGRSQS